MLFELVPISGIEAFVHLSFEELVLWTIQTRNYFLLELGHVQPSFIFRLRMRGTILVYTLTKMILAGLFGC